MARCHRFYLVWTLPKTCCQSCGLTHTFPLPSLRTPPGPKNFLSGIAFPPPEIHFLEHPSVRTCSWPTQFCLKRLHSPSTGKMTSLCATLLPQHGTQLLRPLAAMALSGTPLSAGPLLLRSCRLCGAFSASHSSIRMLSVGNLFLFLTLYFVIISNLQNKWKTSSSTACPGPFCSLLPRRLLHTTEKQLQTQTPSSTLGIYFLRKRFCYATTTLEFRQSPLMCTI